jgi:RHS repeat-associated protein
VQLAAGGTRTYCYDANGNLTGDNAGLSLKYDHQNLAIQAKRGALQDDFRYGPDGMRTRSWGSDGARVYLPGYEHRTDTGETKVYVGDYAVISKTGATRKVEYLLKDRLGSVDAVANASGAVFETRGYDAYGKPRSGSWGNLSPAKLQSTAVTPKGFTQHEHLNQLELVHMNGRVFDYNVGRFTGVDPFIQFPLNSQSLNPYSYILNNPLSGTDPSGYAIHLAGRGDGCNGMQSCELQQNPLNQLQAGINQARSNIGPSSRPAGRWRKESSVTVTIGEIEPVSPNGATSAGRGDSYTRAENREAASGRDQSKSIGQRFASFLSANMFGGITDNGYTDIARDILSTPVDTDSEWLFNTGGPYPSGPAVYCEPNCTVGDMSLQALLSIPVLSYFSRLKAGQVTSVQQVEGVRSAAGEVKLLTSSQVPNAGGKIVSFATKTDQIFYRVYSGDSVRGSFLVANVPGTRALAIEGLALPPQNTAQYVQRVVVPAGTVLQRSRALPAFGRRGGLEQFQLMQKIPDDSFRPGVPFE